MSAATFYYGRQSSTHFCADLNTLVGVDDCLAGRYCIDVSGLQSQCVSLTTMTPTISTQ